MGIATKSIGFLIDELSITNLRCWFAQEDIMNKSLTEAERLEAAINAQTQNAKRTELIRAIDSKLGEEYTNTSKTYTYFKK